MESYAANVTIRTEEAYINWIKRYILFHWNVRGFRSRRLTSPND